MLLILLAGALTVLHAQSSPSISIELSPSRSVPNDTAMTGTVALNNLDVSSYSFLTFRADTTKYGPPKFHQEPACLGEDTNKDITFDVDEGREVFTIRVYKACPHDIYAHYTLDLSLSNVDTSAPGGEVELATASTRFSMSRYLTPGVPTATSPAPDVQAWMEPDPTTLDMYVHGEWHQFRFRTNVLLYLNDHLGVLAYGGEDFHFVAPGEATQSTTVEEACKNPDDNVIHWRRAINQSLWIAACLPGDAVIDLIHETDGVAPLYRYQFPTLAQGRNSEPAFDEGANAARSADENTAGGLAVGGPIAATDDDNDTLTYSLGGTDAASFGIVPETGQLQTGAALDYEAKSSYSVTVAVHDGKDAGGNADTATDDTIDVIINVDNADEDGNLILSPAQPYAGVAVTTALTDPDGDVANTIWRWERSSDRANWDATGSAGSAT